ncbi:MAG: amidase family protein [Actinomycetia bacterium]|nr:amidase family protein [Actinomycetes bacterium]
MRIGLDEAYCTTNVDPDVTATIMRAADVLRERGAETQPVELPDSRPMVDGWVACCCVDTALAHAPYYEERRADYGSVLAALIEQGLEWGGIEHAAIQIERAKFAGAVAALFTEVEAYLSPSLPYPTPTNAFTFMEALGEEEGAVERLISFTAPQDMAGIPAMCLPGGFDADGVPLGFQIVGPRLGEEQVLRAGHAYQEDTDWHARLPLLA